MGSDHRQSGVSTARWTRREGPSARGRAETRSVEKFDIPRSDELDDFAVMQQPVVHQRPDVRDDVHPGRLQSRSGNPPEDAVRRRPEQLEAVFGEALVLPGVDRCVDGPRLARARCRASRREPDMPTARPTCS